MRLLATLANRPSADQVTDRRRWLALIVLCVGQLMIVLDATVVNVALPSIQRDFNFTQASLAWVINGYLITFGGLLLLSGRLGDLVGRRRIFLIGLALFTSASLLCGLASSGELLIAARFVQGVGAATVSAMVLGILVTLFQQPRERATAMSLYAFVASAGGSIGLLVGGVLTQLLSWHWIFFINLPIGLIALALGSVLIPDHRGIGVRHGLDVLGTLLITAAPSLAVYAILEGSGGGQSLGVVIATGLAAVLLALAFVRVEASVRNPLMPLRIFRSRTVVGANVLRALFPVGLFGSFFLGALYLQHVLRLSPMATGFAFLPQNLMVALFSLLITKGLVARFGAKRVAIFGLALVACGLALYSRASAGGGYLDVLPAMLIVGAGAGLFFMPSVSLAMTGADSSDSGVLSGLANVALQIGAALGVALLAGVSSARTNAALAGGTSVDGALTSGYQLGFLLAAAFAAMAVVVGLVVLRPARAQKVIPRQDRVTPMELVEV